MAQNSIIKQLKYSKIYETIKDNITSMSHFRFNSEKVGMIDAFNMNDKYKHDL